MAVVVAYTKQQLIERIKRHIANEFPDSSFSTSDREVLLYIDQAAAFTLVGQVYGMAKVEGNLAMPEAWLTTYNLGTLSRDSATGDWYATLPQPPVSLPLGYSINRVYAAEAGSGSSQDFLPIKAKRVSYRRYMPFPSGGRYWVEGVKLWAAANDGGSLLNYNFYAQMAKTRSTSLTEEINVPDDALELIFNNVVAKLKDRLQLPKDIIADDISSGNKSS